MTKANSLSPALGFLSQYSKSRSRGTAATRQGVRAAALAVRGSSEKIEASPKTSPLRTSLDLDRLALPAAHRDVDGTFEEKMEVGAYGILFDEQFAGLVVAKLANGREALELPPAEVLEDDAVSEFFQKAVRPHGSGSHE